MKECMDSENLHRRLKKINGQVNAVKSALHKVGHIIVEGHLEHCVKDAIEKGDADDALSDISSILEYYSRL